MSEFKCIDISLKDLQNKELTVQELQSVVIKLVDLHNELVSDIQKMVNSGQIRSKQEAMMNMPYGL